MDKRIKRLLKSTPIVKLDIGCGQNKNPGFIGIDYEAYPGVDIVHDVELFPWPLPDACADIAVTSHLLEHLNPHSGDARIVPLIQLLTEKHLITPEEITEYIGELNPGPRFLRFMNEVWRVLKPGAQFASVFPYAGSPGFWQDPTHINGINNMTFWYFDPEEKHVGSALYAFYKPKPWKIVRQLGQKGGNLEVILEKREEKPEYYEANPAEEHDKLAEKSILTVNQD
jgi:SAM-dependent methyltransferase